MKESHRKGVATRPDPESCVLARKGWGEALTGAHAGRVLSCETIATRVPTPLGEVEGHIPAGAKASLRGTLRSRRPLACMETPRARTGRPHSRPPRIVRRTGRRMP